MRLSNALTVVIYTPRLPNEGVTETVILLILIKFLSLCLHEGKASFRVQILTLLRLAFFTAKLSNA